MQRIVVIDGLWLTCRAQALVHSYEHEHERPADEPADSVVDEMARSILDALKQKLLDEGDVLLLALDDPDFDAQLAELENRDET